MKENTAKKGGFLDTFMNVVEAACNKLPPPTILFCYLFVIVAIIGTICTVTGVALVNPATDEVVMAKNLFTVEGLHWFLDNMVKNFTGYGPLGLVLVMTLGIGLCDEAGLLMTLIKSAMKNVPPALVPYVIVFIGIVMNIASDSASVAVPPLAAVVYMGVNKHPVVGLLCGYIGAQVGYAANILPSGTDTLLMGFTNDTLANFLPDAGMAVDATCNWFFKAASTFLCCAVIGTVVTRILEPRFGTYHGEMEKMEEVTPEQKKGMKASLIAFLIYAIIIVALFVSGPLAAENGGIIGSPLLSGLIPILFVLFAVVAVPFGFAAGTFKNLTDVHKAMCKQMAAMGSYVAFCFFGGQFQGLFNWTNIGTISAIAGADFLETVGFTGIPMIIAFIVLCTLIDIFFSSGSAKWAIFAPIFVPMFMLLGYHPAFTQMIYRLGDSAGNLFGPTSAYLWMTLSVAQSKYMPDIKIGTIISCNFTVAFILEFFWIIMLVAWMLLGLPVGPGAPIYLPAGII